MRSIVLAVLCFLCAADSLAELAPCPIDVGFKRETDEMLRLSLLWLNSTGRDYRGAKVTRVQLALAPPALMLCNSADDCIAMRCNEIGLDGSRACSLGDSDTVDELHSDFTCLF